MRKWFSTFTIQRIVWFSVGALVILAALNFYFVHRQITYQERFYPIIDIAGQNRMLSQKIALAAERSLTNSTAMPAMEDALALHSYNLKILTKGGTYPLTPDFDVEVLPASKELQPNIEKVNAVWREYAEVANSFKQEYYKGPRADAKLLTDYISQLDKLSEKQLAVNKVLVYQYEAYFRDKYLSFKSGFILFQFGIMLVFGLIIYILYKQVLKVLACVVETSEDLAESRLNNRLPETGRPEMVRLARSFNKLINRAESATQFAEAIGHANYNVELQSEDSDKLAHALLSMRDKLKQATEQTEQQRWLTESLNEFEVLMRQTYGSTEKLGDAILSKLAEKIKIHQAGLFILNSEEGSQKEYLEMISCYALNRKKYLNKRIAVGEGLAGQAIQELDVFYFTDIPADYPAIKSGLGEAAPTSLLVTPLIYNDEVHGVLELAGYKELTEIERQFIDNLTENIASTLGRQVYAGKIEKLLDDAKLTTEQMHAQEEEMRQHMEEMMATQEEMERKEREYLDMIRELEAKAVAKHEMPQDIERVQV